MAKKKAARKGATTGRPVAKKKSAPRKKAARTSGSETTRKRTSARSTAKKAAAGAAAGGHGGAPTIVYIHGIGPQPPVKQCKLNWDRALFGRDMGERTRMAFWADILHKKSRTRSLSFERAVSDEAEDERDVDTAGLVSVAGVGRGARSKAEDYAERLAATMGVTTESGRSVRKKGVRAKALPLPGFLRKPLVRLITKNLIKDTAAYFYDTRRRDEMRARLLAQLDGVTGPVILVAHSQGTIISYDVLNALKQALDVRLFVTLGSPLGLQEVQDNLKRPLTVPASVRRWCNFADLLDPVALDKGLRNDFTPRDLIEDRIVTNRKSLSITSFNPHSSTGYLETEPVRSVVLAAAGETTPLLERFIVAKDVRKAMRNLEARHPVLIEIKDVDNYPDQDDGAKGARGMTLDDRREALVGVLEKAVGTSGAGEARIDPLKRFVSARLTATEIEAVSTEHRALVYRVWRNSAKRKLLHRSGGVIQTTAARTTYAAKGAGITWAVLDTGVQADHPHFETHDTLLGAWDCVKTGKPALMKRSKDVDGHGTHVAGTIAGEGVWRWKGKDVPMYGTAPLAKLHVYKVLDDEGGGEDGMIIKALDHIAEMNSNSSELVVHGVNLSLGGYFDPWVYGCGHSPICAELRRLWRQGVVVCIACGNEGQITVSQTDGEEFELNTALSIGDPANLEDAIAVGSVNADKPHLFGISHFSSRGPTADGRDKPDVVAPGEFINSAASSFKKGATAAARATHYREDSGTSMACPHVSGLIASFLSVRKEFIGHPDEVKRILMDNCTDLGRNRYHQGRGMPNLMRMLANT